MVAQDFNKAGGKPYAFHWWLWNKTVPSVLGAFALELRTGPRCAAPDEAMVSAAGGLIAFFTRAEDEVVRIVFENYRRCLRKASHLVEQGVPLDLNADAISPFLRDRALVVSRDSDEGVADELCIYITPKWDIEHSLSLVVEDERINVC